ncbi:MAG: hypothetical protein K2N03_07710 [Muribaculaceae bacterium]|nr:hypothetical protein [Muribaculaceae bacterium]
MKKFLLCAAAALIGFSANAGWFISGDFQGWSHCNAAYELKETATAGVFELDFATPKSVSGEFLICQGTVGKPDWNNKIGTNGSKVKLDTPYKYVKNAGNFSFDGAGDVSKITLNTNEGTLLFSGETVENTYDTVYIVGDINGQGWNDSSTNFPMTLKAGTDNVWTADLTITSKSYLKFRAGFNLYGNGLDYGNDTVIVAGQEYTTQLSGQSYVLDPGKYTVTYVLPFNAENGTLSVTGARELPTTIYIIGNVNGEGWNPTNGIALKSEGNGVFSGEAILIGNELGSGYGYFSFASSLGADKDDWDSMNPRYGAASSDFEPTMGDLTTLATTNENFSFKVKGDTEYNFILDFEAMTMIITETPVAPSKLEFTFPEDSINGEVEYEEEYNTYTITVTSPLNEVPVTVAIPEGYDAMYYCDSNPAWARLAADDDEDVQWVPEEAIIASNFIKSNEILVPNDSKGHLYTVMFGKDGLVNTTDACMVGASATYPTSVEGIEAEGEAIFFNLQGVKVANPENGIFVKVVNGKAVKVAL